MERIDRCTFKLSTGKNFYANEGLLSINEERKYLYDGYDGEQDFQDYDPEKDCFIDRFTEEEIIEICDYEIALWTKLKENTPLR